MFEINYCIIPDSTKDVRSRDVLKLSLVASHSNANVTELQQILEALCSSLGINSTIKEKVHPSFIPGRCGSLFFKEKEIGFFGELHPQVLSHWGLEMPASALEMDITELLSLIK